MCFIYCTTASGGSSGNPIELDDLSVNVNSAGTADLSYNNLTGLFTYTPPDLSGYSTFSGNYNDLTNKPTLFSGSYNDLTDTPTLFSGNYNDLSNKPSIPAAYTDASVDLHLNNSGTATGHVLSWNGSDYAWVSQSSGGGGIALTDISVTTTSSLATPALTYNNSTGVISYTPPDFSAYLTAESDTLDSVLSLSLIHI